MEVPLLRFDEDVIMAHNFNGQDFEDKSCVLTTEASTYSLAEGEEVVRSCFWVHLVPTIRIEALEFHLVAPKLDCVADAVRQQPAFGHLVTLKETRDKVNRPLHCACKNGKKIDRTWSFSHPELKCLLHDPQASANGGLYPQHLPDDVVKVMEAAQDLHREVRLRAGQQIEKVELFAEFFHDIGPLSQMLDEGTCRRRKGFVPCGYKKVHRLTCF